ncbi:RNA-binding protein 1 [Chionoecetes opilio]|uniref:RNA-binding protein 1 n=1 Tax=Chionoecetes opilio TaxID=41210 RepID=A0A8J4YHQ1_CHIOP|nr:RNA-binding protein 1 [Chionoecetes opilio]
MRTECKVYVGNLGNADAKHELESAFSKYGPLVNVWVARNPPGFAFVEFEDPRDAEDSVRALDGTSSHQSLSLIILQPAVWRARQGGDVDRTFTPRPVPLSSPARRRRCQEIERWPAVGQPCLRRSRVFALHFLAHGAHPPGST